MSNNDQQKSKPRSVRRRIGDVFAIHLGNQQYAFGRIIVDYACAFYDYQGDQETHPAFVIEQPVLFATHVYKRALTSGRWKVTSNFPLPDALKEPLIFLTMRVSTKGEPMVTQDGQHFWPVSEAEAQTKELYSVWPPELIEERLRCHFQDVPFDEATIDYDKLRTHTEK